MAASDASIGARASESVLTIDLGAIVENYRGLRARLAGARCAAVVKADAYGLGAARVGPALAAAGCKEFFVAQLGEGILLRRALGAEPDIYVLNGLMAGESAEYRQHRLTPVLNDLGQIEAWAEGARAAGDRLMAAIHFDTGMSRLGLTPLEARQLVKKRHRLQALDIRYVMSHLACADEPEHALNQAQLNEFKSLRNAFPDFAASLANSSGIFLGPEYHLDLARPGCALYGINPVPGQPNPMGQVARLDAKVLQTRAIDRPQTVGYGATRRATGPLRVATIAAGYADGWLRNLSNRGAAYAGDLKVPFIGRVSMDLITIDVTGVPKLQAGDTVELMGDHLPVDEVAAMAGTIGYEVLTRLGSRFHRHYVNNVTAPSV